MEEQIKEIKDRFNMQVSFKNVEARFVETTNQRFKGYEGKISPYFRLEGMLAIFGSFHTSYITQVTLEKGEITILTRNSTYIFEILDTELLEWFEDGILFKLSKDDIEIMEKWLTGAGL